MSDTSDKTTPRSCVFCGSTETLTNEHVLPEWMGDRWGRTRMHIVLDRGDGKPVERTGPGFEHQVKCVCERRCNSGWMSRLETRAKPYLISMVEGRGRKLYEEGRKAVATWAVKTSMTFQGKTKVAAIPQEHYRHMLLERGPPPNTQVWLGALEDQHVTPQTAHNWHTPLTLEGADAYGATTSIGHLVMHVVGIGHEDPMTRELSGWASEALIQIWPADGAVDWPPARILNLDGLKLVGSPDFLGVER